MIENMLGEVGVAGGLGVTALFAGLLSLMHGWRLQVKSAREHERTRCDVQSQLREYLVQLAGISHELEKIGSNTSSNLEMPGDGRLGISTRAKALRMLRTGVAAETAAAELGLGRAEVRLLGKVGVLLAPKN